MSETPEEFLPTRHSLLGRLKDWDDQESWRDFFNTYWKLIYGVARKAGLSDDEAQDVVQEAVLSVARKMNEFKYDPAIGSFKGWLLLITRRRIADHLRKRSRQPMPHEGVSGDTSRTAIIERIPDPDSLNLEAVWDAEWEKNLMDAALDRVKKHVSARQYQIFDLYVIKQWPVNKVASTLEISVTQVYLAKHRVSSQLKKELKHLETRMI
jgi:RNA polymerase sigma factor (sigma-70 family)